MSERKVKFLVESKDEDLIAIVCKEGDTELVEVDEYGLHLWRWTLRNKEKIQYIIPLTEEHKMFEFLD